MTVAGAGNILLVVLTLPTTLRDRYRLLDRLGSGGVADVYRGEDLVLERPVAVKVVRDLEAVDRQPFAREVAALARLNHPAIVRLFDGGTDGSLAYLVMEFVEGRSLDALLADEGALAPERVRTIGHDAAGALAHAHAAGLVHRDVKPANILVDDTGRVRVTDFGVARIVDETVTTTAGTLGTAAYLAPEQVESARVGPAADVYALGLVLLECLTGRRAFPGGLTEAAVARLSRDPDVPEELPAPWPGLLPAMTARDPLDRPSAEEVARQLDRRQGDQTTVAVATPAEDAARTQVLDRPAPTPPAPTRPAPDRGGRWLAGLVLALLVLAGWLFLAGGEDTPEDPAADTAEEAEGETPPEPADLTAALDQLEEAVQP